MEHKKTKPLSFFLLLRTKYIDTFYTNKGNLQYYINLTNSNTKNGHFIKCDFLNQSSTETSNSPIKLSSPLSKVCSKHSYELKYACKCITLELYIWINITEIKVKNHRLITSTGCRARMRCRAWYSPLLEQLCLAAG